MSASLKVRWRTGLVVVLVVAVGLLVLGAQQQQIKNPDTLVIARGSTFGGLDAAWEYGSVVYAITINMYDKLYWYKGESITEYEPLLATEVPTLKNGLITVEPDGTAIYGFPIRKGVYFHYVGVRQEDSSIIWNDYDTLTEEERGKIFPGFGELTPEDVKYSYLRVLIQSRIGGGASDLMGPLTGYETIEDLAKDIAGVDDFSKVDEASLIKAFEVLDKVITVKGDTVEIHPLKPYIPFIDELAFCYNNMIWDKEWVIAQGGWPGTAETWIHYHNPSREDTVLYDKENGTGSFKLVSWDKAEKSITLERFEGYWGGPAKLKYIVRKYVPEWTTRRLMLEAGDADIVQVDEPYLEQVEAMEGIVVRKGLPTIRTEGYHFVFNVAADSPAIGSGKLDGNGIPPDFFSDINVRKGFAHAFNYDSYINEVWGGLPKRAKGPILEGYLGYRDDQPQYEYDLAKAEEYFRKAYDGQLWEVGFKFTAYYPEIWGEMAKLGLAIPQEALLEINPKFKMDIQVLDWVTYRSKRLGLSMPYWQSHHPGTPGDPNVTVKNWMKSDYYLAPQCGENFVALCKEKFDPLIIEAVATLDPVKREQIYDQLQGLAYDYSITVFTIGIVSNTVHRDWVQDLIWNPGLQFIRHYHDVWKGY
ncbi:ABC transporter substrate-binding protein [Candidatus Bipolaricaulota bacterium]|nr:ABC transporter substrate-binding protein [Candidatus Bipolaricaulota bacterium]